MVTKVKPTPADLSLRPLGHARENKAAEDYTGFKYPTGGGNDIGVYKQPMMFKEADDVHTRGETLSKNNISLGNSGKNAFAPENPYGKKEMRGYGAATKGRKISGKMG